MVISIFFIFQKIYYKMPINLLKNNRFCGRHNPQLILRFSLSHNQKISHWLFMSENLRTSKINEKRISKNTNICKIREKIKKF